jgi:hypothetical protein
MLIQPTNGDMHTLKLFRPLGLSILLLYPALAEPKSGTVTRQSTGFVCGTSPERQRDALARAQYHESRLARLRSSQSGRYLSQPQPYQALQQDVGDVVVMQDDGTIVVDPNHFNLQGRSFRFEPADSSSYLVVATSTPYDATGGTPINLKDDDSAAITLQSPFTFYGGSYNSVQINSDGNLTFLLSDTASTDRDIFRFISGPPRIGPLFTDLNRELGGTISYRYDPDGLLVVWNNVAEYPLGSVPVDFDSFSVKLFLNGNIEFIYGSKVDNLDSVVGISPGGDKGGIAAVDFTPPLPAGPLAGSIIEAFASKVQLSESAVAKKFFQSHPDSFDHLNLFLGFPYDLGNNAYAYELGTRNEIQGIGMDVFDDSPYYGSNHRLRSFLNMGTLSGFVNGISRYPDNPNQVFLGTNSTLGIMGQESGHRWEAFTRFQDGAFSSTAILGRDLAHWSFFFNSEGSVMEGNEIQDRGASQGSSRFMTVSATDTYSHLDLYIMGLLPSESVPPMFLVQNPYGTFKNAASAPAINVFFGGDRKDLTIDNIIAANGPRVPSTYQAPKVFRQAFIYLTRKGQIADPAEINKVQRIHDAWVKFFNEQTGGRGWIVTNPQDTPATTPTLMNFPYFQGDSTRYTGIAVANWGSAAADVLFKAYDNTGNPLALPADIINPRMMTIAPGAQIAVLAEQILGLTLNDPRNGWIQAQSTSSQVTGFFLDGNIAQTVLSGAVVGNKTDTSLYFLHAQVSPASSAGNSYRNLINVVNPNASGANLVLKLFDQSGGLVTTVSRFLAPHARLTEDLPNLFANLTQQPDGGYVSVTSDNSVVGYQSIDTGMSIYSLPAVPVSTSSQLYSAQFASGPAGSTRYYSDLNLINTGTQSRNIQVLLVGNDGDPVAGIQNPVTLPPLGAGQQYRARGDKLFGLQDPTIAGALVEGSLIVTADGPGVIGDVTFGDPVNFKFIASLPLDGNPVSNLVFSQVAEGGVGTEKPYFTGIAMYNPGPSDVTVTMDVYSDKGAKTGSGIIPLLRGNRISKTLVQLVPAIQAQRGGYIRITATGGSISAFELFGTQTLDFLAAVPPQPITP